MITTMIMSVLFGFLLCLGIGELTIPWLRKLKFGQQVRDDGPSTHLKKSGTPTMGGVIFLLGIVGVWLAFAMDNTAFWVGVLFTLGFGLIGFIDDYIKVVKKRSLGLRALEKLGGQIVIALIMAYYISKTVGTSVWIPFTGLNVEFGIFFLPFVVFVVLGTVNAVNLTDGLDGLASGVMLIISATYAIIYYMLSVQGIMPMENTTGMAVFCAGFSGCLLGFLRFNVYPAKVFMGDSGSLALGGALAYMAFMSNTMLLIPIVGGCLVASTVSVILQVGSYKLRGGKRIFKMAPLHHHFELCGVKETKVVAMYMIATFLLCLVGLLSMLV